MLIEEAIKREKKRIYQQGVKQGLKLVLKQEIKLGMQQANKRIAQAMLAGGEPITKIKLYTGLSAETIKKLTAKKLRGVVS